MLHKTSISVQHTTTWPMPSMDDMNLKIFSGDIRIPNDIWAAQQSQLDCLYLTRIGPWTFQDIRDRSLSTDYLLDHLGNPETMRILVWAPYCRNSKAICHASRYHALRTQILTYGMPKLWYGGTVTCPTLFVDALCNNYEISQALHRLVQGFSV